MNTKNYNHCIESLYRLSPKTGHSEKKCVAVANKLRRTLFAVKPDSIFDKDEIRAYKAMAACDLGYTLYLDSLGSTQHVFLENEELYYYLAYATPDKLKDMRNFVKKNGEVMVQYNKRPDTKEGDWFTFFSDEMIGKFKGVSDKTVKKRLTEKADIADQMKNDLQIDSISEKSINLERKFAFCVHVPGRTRDCSILISSKPEGEVTIALSLGAYFLT